MHAEVCNDCLCRAKYGKVTGCLGAGVMSGKQFGASNAGLGAGSARGVDAAFLVILSIR
jgi:hypothetical protein